MSTTTAEVRLRVVTDNVRLSNEEPVAKGEYAGYIDWRHEPDDSSSMIAVQIIIDGIPSMPSEVLRYVKSGDIEIVAQP